MTQPSLFAETRRIARCPICSYEKHCGHKAELGEPEDLGGCVNCSITCLHCGRTGVESTRKDLS